MRIFGSFTKITKADDGTLVVEGIASSETKDAQGEVVKADAMRAALPDYMKFANVREMHQAIAAGKALAVSVDESGITHLTAHVVDAGSVKKVETGVLQGFSIGGTVAPGGRNKDDPKVIEAIKLTEISLVDRPANPDALITLVKLDAEPEKPLRKGMYSISCAAELLSQLAYLQSDAVWEANAEGDSSPLPGKLKALATEFAAVLREMVGEETAELVAQLQDVANVTVTMAEKPGAVAKANVTVEGLDAAAVKGFVADGSFAKAFAEALKPAPVEKKGKKFSKDTAEKLGAIHKMIDDCSKSMHDLGYNATELTDEDEKKDDDVASAARAGELQKRAADAEAATKAAGDALVKVLGERAELAKRLAEAEVKLATKGVLKVVPVSKADDTGGTVRVEPPPPPENTPERVAYEIKKAHQHPRPLLMR